MSEHDLELSLQKQANIARIKSVFEKVEEEIKVEESINAIDELDFNDER